MFGNETVAEKTRHRDWCLSHAWNVLESGSRNKDRESGRQKNERRGIQRLEAGTALFYPAPSIVGFHSKGGLDSAGVALRIRGFRTIQARGNAKQTAGSSPAQIC